MFIIHFYSDFYDTGIFKYFFLFLAISPKRVMVTSSRTYRSYPVKVQWLARSFGTHTRKTEIFLLCYKDKNKNKENLREKK